MNFKRILEITYALYGRCSHNKRCKHYSFIFKNKKLVSIGMNNPKTHPYNLKFNYLNKEKRKISHIVGTHSELNAVLKLGKYDFKNHIIVNTRVNRNKKIDYSFPCNGCAEMLINLNFEKIFYTTKEGKFNSINVKELKVS